MKHMLAIVALLAAPAIAATEPTPLPAWLAGAWATQDGQSWTDEFWTSPRGDIMIGAGRSGVGSRLQSWETTRIQRKADGSLSFFAQPRGVPASEFPLVASGEEMVEFAQPAHDYPQRIRYWRQGQLLMAEISMMDGSKAVRWNYRPMGQ